MGEIQKQRDSEIVLLRLIGMLMIIGCHLSTYFGIGALGQILNVGVQLFLFISGWIYSEYTITDGKKWIVKRWMRICIPMYIWGSFIYILEMGIKKSSGNLLGLLFCLFNLQGLPFLAKGTDSYLLSGINHLWFLTPLMLCYLLTLIVKKVKREMTKKDFILFCVIGTFGVILLAYAGIYIEYIFIYFLGYFLKKLWKQHTNKQYFWLTAFFMIAMAVRLAGRQFLDGTIAYDTIITSLTHNVLAIWIFGTVKWLGTKTDCIRELANNRIIGYFEGLSYYIYIVHYYFLVDAFGLKRITQQTALQMLLFVILVYVSAVLVRKLDYLLIETHREKEQINT